MGTGIKMNSEILITKESEANKKTIREFQSKHTGTKINYIYSPNAYEENKKVVGSDINLDFVLKSPIIINVTGPISIISEIGSLI